MFNERNYTITLTRLELCDLMLACTHIKWDAIDEMNNDQNCPEYRKQHVLPETVKKWSALHDKLDKQLNVIDCGTVFSDLLYKMNNGEITKDQVMKELDMWSETLK